MAVPAYDAPRVRVAALILLDGNAVLVRHRKHRSVYHLLPGGGVEPGETLEAALSREVTEETGLTIKIGRPLVINDTIDPVGGRHLVNIAFAAEAIGGTITESPLDDRIECVDLLPVESLGELDLRPPIAGSLREFVAEPESFQAVYLGDVFTTE